MDRAAVVELLRMFYPSVHRVAHGLCGRSEAAREVVAFVMSRSLRVLPTWGQEGAPERWFHHHTVLALWAALSLTVWYLWPRIET